MSTSQTGIRFLSPNTSFLQAASTAIPSITHQLLRNELFKIIQLISSSFGPFGSCKLLIDPNQHQLITKSGFQLLKHLKVNSPITQYIINLFQNNTTSKEYCDGTLSCLILAFEILDLIIGSGEFNFANVNSLCNALHVVGELLFNDSILKKNIGMEFSSENVEEMDLFVQSLIRNQFQSRTCVENLIGNWVKVVSEDYTQLSNIDPYYIKVRKQLGKIEDSRLLSNVFMMENLQNLNMRMNKKVNKSICFVSCELSLELVQKINCDIVIVLSNSRNYLENVLVRKCIQSLNERNILIFQCHYSTDATQGDDISLDEIFKLLDLVHLSHLVTCVDDLKDFTYGSANEIKMTFKRSGQLCDISVHCEGSPLYSTLLIKSVNEESLSNLEFQVKKCLKHLTATFSNAAHSHIGVIGGGAFELFLSHYLETMTTINDASIRNLCSEEDVRQAMILLSRALQSIPKQLLRNSMMEHNELHFHKSLLDMKQAEDGQFTLVVGGETGITRITPSHDLTTLKDIPIESFQCKMHTLWNAIEAVVNLMKLDSICIVSEQ